MKPEAAESTIPRMYFASISSKTPSELNCVSVASTSGRSSIRSTTRHVPKRESTLVRITPEVVNSRKRPSEVALSENSQAVNSFTNLKESSSKKAKTESIASKTPLGQVTNTPIVNPSRGVSTMYPSLLMDGSSTFDDPHIELENIQIAMSIQESELDRIRKKPRLSAEDHRTIADRKSELQRLRIYEKETTNRQSHPLTDRMPNVPQPFPMDLEVDRKPFIKSEEPPQPFPMDLEVDRKPIIESEKPRTVRNARPLFPTSSSTPPELERKTLMMPPKRPVASSSKKPSPRFPNYEPSQSDDVDMNPSDSDNEDYLLNGNPTIAADLLNRIGINVPPPIDNDAQDDNGDYYGRGRDLFEGPRASANEYVFAPYFSLWIYFLMILLTFHSFEKFLVAAGNVETFDGNASVDKALKYLKLKNLDDKFPGMEVSLMAHQALGVAWMVEKEKSVFLGGCLADEMGLGKVS